MEENQRILIVDDNRDIHEDFNKILSQDKPDQSSLADLELALFNVKPIKNVFPFYKLDHAFQGDEAILKVAEADKKGEPYALIFMDVRMPPGMDGIETIYRIWREYPLIEMVICTAYTDYTWDEIVTKLGTTDKLLFLKKPFNAIEIKQMTLSLIKKWNLNYQINKIVKDLESEVMERTHQLNHLLVELREKNRKLREMTRQDILTGMLNQAALYEQVHAHVCESKRHGYSLSLIILDLDNFKEINKVHGRTAGDKIIQAVANTLRSSLRLYDVILRYRDDGPENLKGEIKKYTVSGQYGGDEFICIIPYCDNEGAVSITDRIQKKVKKIRIEEAPDRKLTVSMGVSLLDVHTRCPDSNDLIRLADRALWQSKAMGSDQITYITYSFQNSSSSL